MKSKYLSTIESLIITVRKQRVILAADLAKIYGVSTKALNQAVKRNLNKFPPDFIFRLNLEEAQDAARSRSQIVTLNRGYNIKYLPYAFTEHGAIMAANVLNSPRTVQMSVFVVRAFVRMRSLLTERHELAQRLVDLENKLTRRMDTHEAAIVDVLRRIMILLEPPPPLPSPNPRPRIGFRAKK